MKFDRDEFLKVAKVVVKFNKYLRGTDPADLIMAMIGHAYSLDKPGYIATSGFMITAYRGSGGELEAKASISHIIFDV